MAFDKERLKAILGEEIADDVLSEILKAHSQSVSQDKGKIDRLNSELEGLKAEKDEWEKTRQAQMTEQELLQQALEKANAAQAEFRVKSARLDAEAVLVGAGLNAQDYSSLLDSFVSEDAEKSVANARSLVGLISGREELAREQVTAQLLKNTPEPQAGSDPEPQIPKNLDEFFSLDYKEQLALKEANPNLLKTLANS